MFSVLEKVIAQLIKKKRILQRYNQRVNAVRVFGEFLPKFDLLTFTCD